MDRPNPLGQAASKVGTAWSALSGVVSALVAYGVLSSAQGDAVAAAGEAAPGTITALGTIVAGLAPVAAGLVSAFGTAKAARPEVTPMADPRDRDGAPLYRAVER